MEWAFERGRDAKLTATERQVFVAIAYHANAKDGRSFASAERLAADTGLSVATVWRALPRIRAANIVPSVDGRGRRPIEWRFPQVPQGQSGRSVALSSAAVALSSAVRSPITVIDEQELTSNKCGSRGANQTKPDRRPGAIHSPGPRCPDCLGTGWRTGPGGQSFACRHDG